MDLHEKAALEASGRPFRRHPWEQARASLVCSRYRTYLGPGSFVLDIGCGDCFILESLARATPGGVFIGVDSAYPEARVLESGVQVYPSLDQVPVALGCPTLILLMDVIEHIEDDVAFLNGLRMRGLFGPATEVFVTVPAYQLLFSEHDRWLGHYRRYTSKHLQRSLLKGGLFPQQGGYWFALPLAVRVLEVLAEKTGLRKFQATGLVGWGGGSLVTALLHQYLRLEASLIGRWLPGLTCYAACRTRA